MWQTLRRWLGPALVSAIALVALAACSAAELEPAQPLRADSDSGIVILSVTRSGMRDFDLFVWLDGPGDWVPRPIDLRARSQARDWTAGNRWDASPTSEPEGRLVVLKLEPGTYRIDRWSGQSEDGGFHGDGFDIHTAPLDLSFTVEPGTVSYLGSLHIELPKELDYLANIRVATYRMSVDDQRERDLALARSRFAEGAAVQIATRSPQFALAGQDIRYYIHNRKAGDGDFAMLHRP